MPISHFVPDGPDDATPVDIDNNLNIKYVGTGGNAGSGAYLYWYENNSVLAPSGGNMTINLLDALSTGSNTRYFVYSYTSTSKRIKANKPPVSKTATAIEFTMALDEHELAFLAVVVWDKETNAIFSCDPQVGNDPETAP